MLEIFRRWYRERLLSEKDLSSLRYWGRASDYEGSMSGRVILFSISIDEDEFSISVEGESELEDRTPGRWRAVRGEGVGAPYLLTVAMNDSEDVLDTPLPDTDELAEQYQDALRASPTLHSALRRGIPLLHAILLGTIGLGWEREEPMKGSDIPHSLILHIESLVKCLHSTLRNGDRYLEMAHIGEERVRVTSRTEETEVSLLAALSASHVLVVERGWKVDGCESL